MNLIDEYFRPAAANFLPWHWVLTSMVVGFFLGFVDTIFIGAIMGYAGVRMPAYFGVPTTFSGYFLTGMMLGRIAPPTIFYHIPLGIILCSLLFMWGMAGPAGQGGLAFISNFVLIPAVAGGVCYLGVRLARRSLSRNLKTKT